MWSWCGVVGGSVGLWFGELNLWGCVILGFFGFGGWWCVLVVVVFFDMLWGGMFGVE